MPGYFDVTRKLEGRYVELKSRGSGKIWKGKIKKVTIKEFDGKEKTRRILFEDGREVIAHDAFTFTIKQLD